MTLEKSPSFDDLEKKQSEEKKPFPRWVRFVLISTVVLLGSGLLLFGGSKLWARASVPPGGLDGCLVNAVGNPLIAVVKIGQESRQSYEDGCFFFPELPAGKDELVVHTDSKTWTFSVEIISNQAVGLGILTLR